MRALANALDTGRIHHAYLFTGTRGVGKTTLARILAKALNCLGPDGNGGVTSTPCGVCKSCLDIDAGRFVDLLEVDAATNTKVDEMRELLETAQYAPVSGRYKVYIIDEVHMLSKSAFNAMLKTLEEPPGHVEFILATTDPQKLPITVLSRCLQFNLKNLPPAMIAAHLARVLEAERINFEVPALEMLGRAAEGSVRDSLSLLDQAIAYGAGEVKSTQVASMLGALDQSYLFSIVGCLADGNAKQLVSEIEQLAQRSISFDMTLKDLAGLLSRIALIQSVGEDAAEGVDAPVLSGLAGRLRPDQVQLFYQIALLGRRDLALAPDEQCGFTMSLLRMLAFGGAAAGGAGKVRTDVSTPFQEIPRSYEASVDDKQAVGTPPPVARTQTATADYGANQLPEIANWAEFIAQLKLAGMAGMLAKQCEFQSFEGGVLDLVVPPTQKHLADKPYQEKLRLELLPKLGQNLRLNIRVADVTGASLAALEDRVRTQQQSDAEGAIEQDPFIRGLKQEFGAEVLQDSIRPATEH